jgi:hypothetical protein
MKNLVARTLTPLLFLGVLLLGPVAHAQRVARVIQANIPFAFSVGNRIFPAGNYSLVSTARVLLELRDPQGRTLVKVLTNSVETLDTPAFPRLRFERGDDGYSLAQVWQENDSIGQQLQPSKARAKSAKRHSERTQTIAADNSQ